MNSYYKAAFLLNIKLYIEMSLANFLMFVQSPRGKTIAAVHIKPCLHNASLILCLITGCNGFIASLDCTLYTRIFIITLSLREGLSPGRYSLYLSKYTCLPRYLLKIQWSFNSQCDIEDLVVKLILCRIIYSLFFDKLSYVTHNRELDRHN